MNRQRKFLAVVTTTAILAVATFFIYKDFIAPTRIVLLNVPNFMATSIAKSTNDRFIEVTVYDEDEISEIRNADFVFIFAMGLNITAEQRGHLQGLAESGIPFFSTAVTNPDNDITNVDSIHVKVLNQYLQNRNKSNYQNMLRYIRANIDGKRLFAPPPGELLVIPSNVFYHLDENQSFETIEAYLAYYRSIGRYKEGAPKVAIIGSIGDPFAGNREHIDSLIIALENSGLNVFPILAGARRLEMVKQVSPDAVIYMPHGRLAMGRGDVAVEWLKEQNIPLFAPTTILTTEEEWLNDPMGMSGGFLSQSVVMPELDGAIYPYTLIAQRVDRDGFYLFTTIPDRLKSFVEIVNNFLFLRSAQNSEKRLAIVYFKGPGQSSLVASGLEVVPSLFNFLHELKMEGYNLEGLPADLATFEQMVMQKGATFGQHATGAIHDFIDHGKPALISGATLLSWMRKSLPEELITQLETQHGSVPGNIMTTLINDIPHVAVARLQFGNVALLPQPAASGEDNHFQMVHGTGNAPPYSYVAAYLWARHGFEANALVHFGTHGSLEFTPSKQVSLSSLDWPDRLVGTMPHFYLYTISNVGEGIIAKRRSYATLISHLTPPFMESDTREQFRTLNEKIKIYHNREGAAREQASIDVKKLTINLGLHHDLDLDSNLAVPFTTREIERVENFADELANEMVTGQLYTLGIPYTPERIRTSVLAMSIDPLAYNLAALNLAQGKVTSEELRRGMFFTAQYRDPAQLFVEQVLDGKITPDANAIAKLTGIPLNKIMMLNQISPSASHPGRNSGGHPGGHPGSNQGRPQGTENSPISFTEEKMKIIEAVATIKTTAQNILNYKNYLKTSPSIELQSLLNALDGGYVAPSPGGDAIANPNTLPTGRNLFSINAEATPSESAWDKGVLLARKTLETYSERHGELPRKVTYTFWAGEFIETEGATIAQAFYMLGVSPVWDAFGRVSDLRLIPSSELGRPRIDVVAQTSGQLRDIAASRLKLLNRAVEMAANATGDQFPNHVAEGSVETERLLVEKGATPLEARQMSLHRIFGGINGSYGTGIMGMVESGDRWEDDSQIAEVYLHNMSAIFGDEENWGEFRQGLLAAVLHNADLVIHPRQNNTWGPISLDHVYEFMGGMNLAIRHVTGQDPDAYFSDYRNRHNPKVQEAREAIGIEARSTIFNPAYIREQMKGSASSAGNFAQVINNIYGWNVMKPDAINKEIWDKIHSVYVEDEYNLGIREFFERINPAALQEISAIMMETARKGYWPATPEQLNSLANLHAQLVDTHGPACSGFVCDNMKLRQFIAQRLHETAMRTYQHQIGNARGESANAEGTVMSREQLSETVTSEKSPLSGLTVGIISLGILAGLIIWIRVKRKK